MATTLKPALFGFDDGEWLRGWTIGYRWNGWGCPYFDAEQLPAVLQEFRKNEYSVEQTADGTVVLNHDDAEDADAIKPCVIDGKRVWSFGFGYTWNERRAGAHDSAVVATLREFSRAASALLDEWERADSDLDSDYPFTQDFAEVVLKIQQWTEKHTAA